MQVDRLLNIVFHNVKVTTGRRKKDNVREGEDIRNVTLSHDYIPLYSTLQYFCQRTNFKVLPNYPGTYLPPPPQKVRPESYTIVRHLKHMGILAMRKGLAWPNA